MSTDTPQHNVIIFDIDSASIGVSVVGYSSSQQEHWTKRVPLNTRLPFESFFAHTLRSLEEVAKEALLHTPAGLEGIYMVLGTPWANSQKRTIEHHPDKPFIFNESLAHKLVQQEMNESLSKNIDYHAFGDLEVFERRTIATHINGYPSLYPFKHTKEVQQVAITSLTSVTSHTTREAFVHAIERVFHREPVLISNTFVNYHAVRTLLPHHDDTVVIDVGGTNTDVLIVRNDHLESIASFPIGMKHIEESISEHAGVDGYKARSLIKMYTQNILEEEYKIQLTRVMEKAFKVWMTPWYEVSRTLSAKKLLPSTLTLISSASFNPWLRYHILKSDELQEHIHTQGTLQIIDLAQYLNAHEKKKIVTKDSAMIPAIDLVGILLQESTQPHNAYD